LVVITGTPDDAVERGLTSEAAALESPEEVQLLDNTVGPDVEVTRKTLDAAVTTTVVVMCAVVTKTELDVAAVPKETEGVLGGSVSEVVIVIVEVAGMAELADGKRSRETSAKWILRASSRFASSSRRISLGDSTAVVGRAVTATVTAVVPAACRGPRTRCW